MDKNTEQQPVGVADWLIGAPGFPMAVFRADDVPPGTNLYAGIVSPAAELTDEEIVDELAKHGVGMLGHTSDVEPFPLDGDDAPIFIAAYRALLARSPDPIDWALKQKWYNEGYNDGKELAPATSATSATGIHKAIDALKEIDHISQAFHEGGYGPNGDRKAMRRITELAQTWLTLCPAEQKAAQPAAMPKLTTSR